MSTVDYILVDFIGIWVSWYGCAVVSFFVEDKFKMAEYFFFNVDCFYECIKRWCIPLFLVLIKLLVYGLVLCIRKRMLSREALTETHQ